MNEIACIFGMFHVKHFSHEFIVFPTRSTCASAGKSLSSDEMNGHTLEYVRRGYEKNELRERGTFQSIGICQEGGRRWILEYKDSSPSASL
jgi:hypothetical protein